MTYVCVQVNYIMGVNPQGYSLITQLGAKRIYNAVDDESVYDDWVSGQHTTQTPAAAWACLCHWQFCCDGGRVRAGLFSSRC